MNCCDTCKHFVILPSKPERIGWCNAPLPEWVENMAVGPQASLMKATDGKECSTYQDAPLP
jgi:hypothetical protein